jgi:ectoine hydroxylase-related dioxygenase (phytanoyl-CoA dioxygenase family)
MNAFYEDNGYLVVERVFTDDELAGVRRRTEEIIADPSKAPKGVHIGREADTVKDKTTLGGSADAVRNISFMVRFDPTFQAFARNPKLLNLTRELIGPRVKVFRDQMLLKPPGGQDKPPHQDNSYFRVNPPGALVTAWVALDDATLENGCMRYVPGSHRYGILEMEPDSQRPVHHVPKTAGLTLRDEVTCPVPKGSVIFHHGLTLHRSTVNQTQTWRKALILHFATSDARSEIAKLNEEVSLAID